MPKAEHSPKVGCWLFGEVVFASFSLCREFSYRVEVFQPGTAMDLPLAMFSPGPMEMLILGIIAVLLFGKRLPEVGRSLGRGLMEFRRGLNEIENEINAATRSAGGSSSGYQGGYDGTADPRADEHVESTAPKFEPPLPEAPAETGAEQPAEGQ